MRPIAETHEVFNQPPALEGANFWRLDPALRQWCARYGASHAEQALDEYGVLAGGELFEAGFLANENRPRFHSHDRFGHRIDQVDYNPAYHQLMRVAIGHGLPAAPWQHPGPGAQVARTAMMYLHNQADAGSSCPLTMSFASVPVLRQQPDLAAFWLPRLFSGRYDPRNVPAADKPGVTLGMAMTEKQGGTDVRANTTRARPVDGEGPGEAFELLGHKWFCSAPMSDAFLTLAYTAEGLGCFLLPRFRPDGRRNAVHIQGLKDKLGNWSNASAEVEFHGALAWRVGEPGRGVRTILEMVALTRFDCITGSASLMRQALTQALHHCRHRSVGGRRLIAEALMRNVLADLAVESEAALALAMRLAHGLDNFGREGEQPLFRLLTAVGKFWVCKRAPAMIQEAAECLGGAGYVEQSILPRLYREAPVNSIWEGSGNVQCLDALRTLERLPQAGDALLALLDGGHGDARLAAHVQRLKAALSAPHSEWQARQLVESIAVAVQGRLLLDAGESALADAFLESRLEGRGRSFGCLADEAGAEAILARALA